MNILLVEDDQSLNQNITEALQAEGVKVQAIYDGLLAERILKRDQFDCIILDINLPGKNGFDLCREFRMINQHTPVIMLTAFSELEDKVEGFNCGADDYLTKPFYMTELIMRIKTHVNRSQISTKISDTLTMDDVVIQLKSKKVLRQNQEIQLTPREYQILVKLIENKGEVVSKSDLVSEIWGKTFDANTNTIEVYINFLRNKVDKPFGKNSIKTKVGYGYYFES
ncbi:MAG TPA: response regulator transcription factor [Taishania sp.]|nr:response regulator transcription factor [Taishania sp.]